MGRSLRQKHGTGGFRVEVTGFRELYDALEQIDKKAARVVTREIGKVGKSVATDASYRTPGSSPLSGWGTWNATGRTGTRDLGYNPAAASAGFKVKRNNFRRRGVSAGLGFDVVQTNAGASIFEIIGSGKRVTSRSGANLVRVVNQRFPGRNPRSLIPAYYAQMTGQRERIRDLILTEARKAGLR